MKNKSIKSIMSGAFVLVTVIGISFVVTSHIMLGSIKAASTTQVQQENAVLALKDASFHIIQIQQFLTDVSATHNPDGFDEAQQHSDQAKALLNQLKTDQPDLANSIDIALIKLDEMEQSGKLMANAYIQSGREAGNALMQAPESGFDVRAASLSALLDEISKSVINNLEQASAYTLEKEGYVDQAIVAFSIGLLMIFGIVLAIIYHKIIPPVQNLIKSLVDMNKGNGDLTKRIQQDNKDEIGSIIAEFNQFVSMLQSMIIEVSTVTNSLGLASEGMSNFTEQTRQGVQRQRLETDQVATAMTEMSATVSEIARNAVSAADATNNASERSLNGKTVVHSTIESIESLANEIRDAGSVINSLEENSNKIGTILTVIQSIAEQTNLLALNAAIEAARAGEQGRGFAVVADEVRSLATRTHEATQEIQNMIQQLQDGAKSAVHVMQVSQEKAATSVNQATTAGTALDEITEIVARITDMNTQIAAASEEQSAVAEEINRNVAAIIEVAANNDNGAEQISNTSKSLSNYTSMLGDIIGKFQIK